MTTKLLPPPAPQPSADAERAARLARLEARNGGSAAGAGARPSALRPAAGGAGAIAGQRPVPAGNGGRRHAARGSRTAALVMSAASTAGLAGWFAHSAQATTVSTVSAIDTSATEATSIDDAAATIPTTAAATTAVAANSIEVPATSASATAASADSTAAAAPATSAAVATATVSGTYNGAAVSTRYGTVQVAVVVSNGTITDVKALALPSGGKNAQYSNRSAPVLRTEALAAQSADINIVSGATYTSKGYIQSLQSAIDEAVAAGALAG